MRERSLVDADDGVIWTAKHIPLAVPATDDLLEDR